MSLIIKKKDVQTQKNVIDDIDLDNTLVQGDNMELDNSKLEELKSKLAKKEIKTEKVVSLKLGILGLGHAGSRIAESFYKLGYKAIALNTATQDLVHISLPEDCKLFLDTGIQGAAKDLARGEEAAIAYKDKISELIDKKLQEVQVLVVCSSAGGGSGAGSLPTIIDICQQIGKPIVLISVLPMVSEDVKTKANSLDTVSKLASYIKEGKAHSFVLIDNARIETIHANVGQMEFYKVANKAIVEPLDVFNTYSMYPSDVKALDSAEFATILLNGNGISTYGQIVVDNYEEEASLAEAVVASLQENLLASGLDYKQAKYVGYMIIANKNAWQKIPAVSINYVGTMINDIFGNPEATYKGIYESNDEDDSVKIYTFVSGLGIPEERIKLLKEDVEVQQKSLLTKDVDRMKKLTVDIGKNNTVSDVDKLKNKIASKMSGVGKLTSFIKK